MRRNLIASLAVVLCLLLAACSASQVTMALNGASSAIAIASVALSAAPGIDSGTKAAVAIYLDATSSALSEAAQALEGGTITPRQVAAIGARLAATVEPALPASVPLNVHLAIRSAAGAVQAFLGILQAQAPPAAAQAPHGLILAAFSPPPDRPVTVKLTRRDRALLRQSRQEIARARAALRGMR